MHDDTGAFLDRLAAAAPDLSDRQVSRVLQLLETTQPSPPALARVRQLLHNKHEDTPKAPR